MKSLVRLAATTVAAGLACCAPAHATAPEKPMTDQSPASPARSRIPLLTPDEMTPEQRAAYDANPHTRINLGLLLAQARTLGPAFTKFNEIMATTLTVPPLEREIMCLATLHLDRGEYEWAQHVKVAEMMGIPKAKVDAIAAERFGDPVFTDRERALLAFTRQVVKMVRVDDPTFNAVAAFYDPRQIVESILVISNYMMILRVSEVAELPIDGTGGADFWKNRKVQ